MNAFEENINVSVHTPFLGLHLNIAVLLSDGNQQALNDMGGVRYSKRDISCEPISLVRIGGQVQCLVAT